MPVDLLYIYRRGATNACALTGEKNDPRLPAPLPPDQWQFWMQISCHQAEEGLLGFAMETALTQVAARGYYLFTGSAWLLAPRVVTRAAAPQASIVAIGTVALSTAE
jgi:hypothetical protein